VQLTSGVTVTAGEQYLRESILHPGAKIVAGYQNIMPTFAGLLNEEEVNALVAFIGSLKTGGTPSRVETFPPPVRIEAQNEAVRDLPGAEDREP
jgi:cytochrome c oxidase subunit 2